VFIVWDKAAQIGFIAGLDPVYANFSIDERLLEDIRRQTAISTTRAG
jgi:hypothetical protein